LGRKEAAAAKYQEEGVFRRGVCSNSLTAEELKEPLFFFGKVNLDLLSTLYMPTTRKRERERSEGVLGVLSVPSSEKSTLRQVTF